MVGKQNLKSTGYIPAACVIPIHSVRQELVMHHEKHLPGEKAWVIQFPCLVPAVPEPDKCVASLPVAHWAVEEGQNIDSRHSVALS